MSRCTNYETFEAQMENLEPTETKVVISVLENLLDKAVTSTDKMEMAEEISTLINSYFAVIESAARANPGSRFVLIDPILRPKLLWYEETYDMIKETHKEGSNKVGLTNVSRVDVISRASQQFEQDGVHLTKASGKIFVKGILDQAERIFKATFVDLGEDDNNDGVGGEGSTGGESVEARVERLEIVTAERRWNDNLLFARTREELDTAANKLKEDRIIMTGLTSKSPAPADRHKRNEWMRTLVVDTIKRFKPDFDGRIVFINQGKNNGKEIPMVEAKLASVEAATAVRKSFAEKRKENDGKALGKLYIANSVSLSTRVRVDIMKAIAKKVSNDKESAHVAAYSSRPILHVKTNQARGDPISRAYTFIDAVIRFGKNLVRDDLGEAYRRAGTAFKGQMEQHYVVLNDEAAGSQNFNPSQKPESTSHRSGKRGRDHEGESSSSKNKRR